MCSMKNLCDGGRRRRKVMRRLKLLNTVGIGNSTLYDWLNPKSPRYDPSFPKQVKLGARSVGWMEDEIEAWLEARLVASRD